MASAQQAGSRGQASSPALSSPLNRQASSSTTNASAQWTTSDPPSRSPISSRPPTLPPIPRVASILYSPMDRPQALRTQSEAVETYGKSETYGKKRDDGATDTDSTAVSPVIAESPTTSTARSPNVDQEEQMVSPTSKTTRSISNPAVPKQPPQSNIQSPKEARSVSLAIPYANTAAAAEPVRGNRPHQAETNVKGVPQHARTSSTTISEPFPSPKAGKRGRSLKNPVSLLLRRRSSQLPSAVNEETTRAKGPTIPPMDLPEDFDPRIRGSVVHDFSAPRPKRQTSYIPADPRIFESSESTIPIDLERIPNDGHVEVSNAQTAAAANGRDVSGTQGHTQESAGQETRDSTTQGESLANHDFLSRASWQSQDSGALPSSAPKIQQQHQQFRDSNDDWKTRLSGPSTSSKSEISAMSRPVITDDFGFQSPVSSATATTQDRSSRPISNDAYTRFSSASLQSGDGQAPTTVTSSPPRSPDKGETDLSVPKHVKSNASRFSFQLSGQDSIAEEKLLEAKANLKRESAHPTKQGVVSDDEDEVFDEDAMYDHDELEDDQAFGRDGQDPAHLGLGITHNTAKSGIASNYAELSSSGIYGSDGQFGGDEGIPRASSEYGDGDDRPAVASLQPSNTLKPQQVDASSITRSRASHDFDDDLYWTDGAIAPVNAEDVSEVNEEDFDRPDFLKKDKPHEEISAHSPSAGKQSTADGFKVGATRFEIQDPSKPNTFKDSPMTIDQPKMFSEDLERPGDRSPAPSRQDSAPGKNTMTAYHSALADSVQLAAHNGRFTRQPSNATSASAYSSHSPERELIEGPAGAGLGPIARTQSPFKHQSHQSRDSYSGFDFGFNDPRPESRNEQTQASGLPEYAFPPEDSRLYDDDDFDADDDIIAEANAGALANDDAGFYGQEFGFFAKARPGFSDEDNVHGGYFGERGFDMVQRKWSTKEPNLTPITERSEFSTRNSYIGGHFSPGGAQMSSPAFAAQLARMSPIALAQLQEQEMSLDQVVRMRNLALNGREDAHRSESMSSLSSAAGHSQAFPASQRGSWQTAGIGSQFMPKGGVPMAFQYSTESSGSSNAMSRTQSDMHDNHSAAPLPGEHRNYSSSPIAESQFNSPSRRQDSNSYMNDPDTTPRKGYVDSPVQNNAPYNSSPRQVRTHSRTGSGADNVTYKREKDASGNDRWVLERRRTSENGFVELVGREVVEGGRI